MAAAAAAAVVLGLRGDKEDEEDVESVADPEDPASWESDSDLDKDDDPPLDEEAIEELKAEFWNSLVRVFDYSELVAQVLQDKLYVNEQVDLLQAWGSNTALEYACNNLICGTNHIIIDGKTAVFWYSMSQDLILYWNWVNLRMSRGLGAEATDFKRKECTFMRLSGSLRSWSPR
jgi:hypothetical protein